MFGFCFVVLFLMTFLIRNILDGEEWAGCFTLIVSLMTCDCKCSMICPHRAVGWAAVCDCGII